MKGEETAVGGKKNWGGLRPRKESMNFYISQAKKGTKMIQKNRSLKKSRKGRKAKIAKKAAKKGWRLKCEQKTARMFHTRTMAMEETRKGGTRGKPLKKKSRRNRTAKCTKERPIKKKNDRRRRKKGIGKTNRCVGKSRSTCRHTSRRAGVQVDVLLSLKRWKGGDPELRKIGETARANQEKSKFGGEVTGKRKVPGGHTTGEEDHGGEPPQPAKAGPENCEGDGMSPIKESQAIFLVCGGKKRGEG